MKWLRRAGLAAALAATVWAVGCRKARQAAPAPSTQPTTRPAAGEPLRIIVMDPLADQLACACVGGFAQRKYPDLCRFLSRRLGRPVAYAHAESLARGQEVCEGKADLIIGRRSLVTYDAAETAAAARPIAMLTDRKGATDLSGLFVVRADDPAKALPDLAGRRLLLGPPDSAETHADALAALKAHNVAPAGPPETRRGCNAAALAVLDKEADAAVVCDYSLRLMEGCGVLDPGSLRVIGKTAPAPFVTVFATGRVDPAAEKAILDALRAVRDDPKLLEAMESRDGFVPAVAPAAGAGWPDWRGPNRDGLAQALPDRLPAKPRILWRRPMTGWGLSGVAATTRYVIVADKDPDCKKDVWRCFDARTGEPAWQVQYDAPGEMDWSNSPRAAPVIRGERVYLLGAFGHLLCVRLADGGVLWRKNVVKDFGAKPPDWGMCATPLLAGDRLIVNPGAPQAALVALDPADGRVVWQTPGRPAAYSSFIRATLGGVDQVVGYDDISLGGWDPATGKRLWELTPPVPGDFNVATPVAADGRLLAASENNGTRLYGFDDQGRILPEPLAVHEGLAPDIATPIVLGGRALGCCGKLFCLDARDGLKQIWAADDEEYGDYCALIGAGDKALVVSVTGVLSLVRVDGNRPRLLSRLKVFDKETEVWSHPALVADRLYLRSREELVCLKLD